MLKQDLERAGIINKDEISNMDLATLLLKYNKKYIEREEISRFDNLLKKVQEKFNGGEDSNEYLTTCLAVCCRDFQTTFLKQNNALDKLLSVHELVVNKFAKDKNGKENIREARRLADIEDSMKIKSQTYKELKDSLDYLKACLTEEDVFNRFYKNFENRMDESAVKTMLKSKYDENKKGFLEKQSKYFDLFLDYQIKEDSRLIILNEEKIC